MLKYFKKYVQNFSFHFFLLLFTTASCNKAGLEVSEEAAAIIKRSAVKDAVNMAKGSNWPSMEGLTSPPLSTTKTTIKNMLE
jgi:hypothetical protein